MSTVANNAGPTAPPSGPYPSDETILGIFDDSAAAGNISADDVDALFSGAAHSDISGDDSSVDHSASIPHRADGLRSRDAARPSQDEKSTANATRDSSAQNLAQGTDPPMPDWLARLSAADPNATPELSALWQRSAALDAFDHAVYDGDAGAQHQLIAQLYSDAPNALRAMVAAANELLARTPDSAASSAQRYSKSGQSSAGILPANVSGNSENENSRQVAGATNAAASAQFNPAAYAQFEQSTNDAVVSDVNRAIERALDRALPNGIADGARRRIAGDTLAEVHTALRGDRQLASQVAGALRNSQFDSATRDSITRLIASRARGVVPEAARRVIGEWTGSVLASHRERTAKQQSSSARVDVIGGALANPIPQRATKSSDINYRATSDEDILSW